jgi:hypothetical protein
LRYVSAWLRFASFRDALIGRETFRRLSVWGMPAGTTTTCEGCGDSFTSPGLGRPRRYCLTCAPPNLPGLKLCSHGVPHRRPCAGCWGIEVRKRQCRRTGGQFSGGPVLRYETLIVEEQQRYEDELKRLTASDLDAKQRAEVRGWLDRNLAVSRKDLRNALRRARAEQAT